MRIYFALLVVICCACSKPDKEPSFNEDEEQISQQPFSDLFCGYYNIYKKTTFKSHSQSSTSQEVDLKISVMKDDTDSILIYGGYKFYYKKHSNPTIDSLYHTFVSEIDSDSFVYHLQFNKNPPVEKLEIVMTSYGEWTNNHYVQYIVTKTDWCTKISD